MSESAVLLQESWQMLRSRVDARLEGYLQQLNADCPRRLREAMSYSLLGGGKRLRPVLVLLAAEACGGELEDAMPAACALEMVHTYSLIHDDLPAMDDDDLRRGRPTCHLQFDEATSILAGDALLTFAFQILSSEIQPPEIAAACCAELSAAAGPCGMVGGQMDDIQAEHSRLDGIQQLEAVHRRKTGRLIGAAVLIGARIAGAGENVYQSVKTYGESVGLAFQIADDLLDLHGDATTMGKSVRKDSHHGKLTYPALLGAESSRRRAEELVAAACRAIEPLGESGRRLEALAHFVLERDH